MTINIVAFLVRVVKDLKSNAILGLMWPLWKAVKLRSRILHLGEEKVPVKCRKVHPRCSQITPGQKVLV